MLSPDVVLFCSIARHKTNAFIESSCVCVFLKHPQNDVPVSQIAQTVNSGFHKLFSVSSTYCLRQKINGHDLSTIREFNRSGLPITCRTNIFTIFQKDKHMSIRSFQVFNPRPARNTIEILLRGNAFVCEFPALFIYPADCSLTSAPLEPK